MPVYFLQAGAFGDIKIGSATDPLARMRQLQTSFPKKLRIVRVLEGGLTEEKALHERFATGRLAGEWFRHDPSMLTVDVGLRDLEIPFAKRSYYRPNLETAWGRWRQLKNDMLEIIGGAEALARALAIPPWVADDWRNSRAHLPALVVLARQAGAPVTFIYAQELLDASEGEQRAIDAAGFLEARRTVEREWIERNGVERAWWPLTPLPPVPQEGADENEEEARSA